MLPLSDSSSILAGHITTEADLAASGEDRNGGPMRYEKAETVRPTGNDDALLRWNTCARQIMSHRLQPRQEQHVEPSLE